MKHMLKNIKYKMQKIKKVYRKREKSISTNLLFMGKTDILIRPVYGEREHIIKKINKHRRMI